MSLFNAVSLLIALVAVCGYLNARFVKLPDVIGITAVGLILSVLMAIVGNKHPEWTQWAQTTLNELDFTEIVFHGMLGMLLFAGSLHVNFSDLKGEKWVILPLATLGVLISTTLVGTAFYYATHWLGAELSYIHCLLFGALISPTDPIAVLGILRKAGVPKSLETQIAGESLFNDGIGVVVFITLLGIATGGHAVSPGEVAMLLAEEVIGGVIVGVVLGYLAFVLLRSIDSYAVEILITLALTTAGYAAAEQLHTSAPIAVVLMGLIIGNRGKSHAMSETTRHHLFSFWDLIDELLNLMLFGLIGLEVIALSMTGAHIQSGLVAIVIVLLARLISVGLPISALRLWRGFVPHAVKMLTWGGLRGGISVALALSLPEFPGRHRIIATTYVVVVFSILVQALTVAPLVRRLGLGGSSEADAKNHANN